MSTEQVLIGIFLLINTVAFFVMFNDKRKSMQSGSFERTPEGLLFFLAAAFGGVGVYAGMFAFRHKTRKWYFIVGMPLLVMENVATFYVIHNFLQTW